MIDLKPVSARRSSLSLTLLSPGADRLMSIDMARLDAAGFAWEVVRRLSHYRNADHAVYRYETLRSGAAPILLIEQTGKRRSGGLIFRRRP